MKRVMWTCMIALGLSACAGAPTPKVQAKTPEELKASKIDGLRSALSRQFKQAGENKPLYMGELRGILQDLIAMGETDAEIRLNLAQVFVFENRYEQALKILEALVAEDDAPEFIQSYGQVLITLERFEQAESLFIRDQETHPERLGSLGHAAVLAWKRGATQKALGLAHQVLLKQPLNARALEVVIRDALAQGKDGIASLLLERARTGNVHSPELSWLAGLREEKRGELAKALRWYREGSERFAQSFQLREAMAAVALKLQDGAAAHEAYTWLLNQEPTDLFWKLGLAVAARITGRLEEAARLYGEILVRDPDFKDALWNDGLLAFRYEGDYERAHSRFSRLSALVKQDASGFSELANLLSESNALAEEDKAIAAEEEAERKAQAAVQNVCDALRRSQEPDFSALTSQEILVDAGWDLLAQAEAQLDEAPAQAMEQAACAFAVAEKAESFKSDHCAAMHHSWAKRMNKMGDRVEAVRHLKAALTCNPEHEDARKLMDKVSVQ